MEKLREALQRKRKQKGDLNRMHEDEVREIVKSSYLDDGGGGGDEEGLEDNCVDISYRTFVLTVNGSVTWLLIHCQVPKFNG